MTTEEWVITRTRRFRADVAHYQPPEASLERWVLNVAENAPTGTRLSEKGDCEHYDYDVGEFVISYAMIHSKAKLMFLTLRRADEPTERSGIRWGTVWSRFAEAVSVWSGVGSIWGKGG